MTKFQPHPNSLAAYESMRGNQTAKVEDLIRAALAYRPMATWEIEIETRRKHQTISASMNALRNRGQIVVVGSNLTDSRRKADVYALTGSEWALAVGAVPHTSDRRKRSDQPAAPHVSPAKTLAGTGGASGVIPTSPRRSDAQPKEAAFLCETHGLVLRHPVTIVAGFATGICPAHGGKGLSPARVQTKRFEIPSQ